MCTFLEVCVLVWVDERVQFAVEPVLVVFFRPDGTSHHTHHHRGLFGGFLPHAALQQPIHDEIVWELGRARDAVRGRIDHVAELQGVFPDLDKDRRGRGGGGGRGVGGRGVGGRVWGQHAVDGCSSSDGLTRPELAAHAPTAPTARGGTAVALLFSAARHCGIRLLD